MPMQDVGYGATDAGSTLQRRHAGIIGITYLKGVHYDPVFAGDDLGIQDLQAHGSHHSRYFRENPGSQIIEGHHGIFAGAQRVIESVLNQHPIGKQMLNRRQVRRNPGRRGSV